jgi:transposase
MTMMTQDGIFVGIDVSKDRPDVAVLGGERFHVSNDAQGFAALIGRLAGRPLAGIGLEASGGYARRARHALRDAGLPVRRIDSWRLRQFAKALGQRAKLVLGLDPRNRSDRRRHDRPVHGRDAGARD